jgi:hypothetical protein
MLSFFQANLAQISLFFASPRLRTELAESKSVKLPKQAAEMLVMLRGDLAAAKIVAEYKAAKAEVEDKNEIADLVKKEREAAPGLCNAFKVQLAATVDGAYALIFSTYAGEGDGVTVFFEWELWNLAHDSINLFATQPENALTSNLGLPLTNITIWRNNLPEVRAIFEPARAYLAAQQTKHAATLEFLKVVNGLCPWNATRLTRDSLDFFVSKKLLTEAEANTIENDELKIYVHHSSVFLGAAQPTPSEYFLRQSPRTLLPEARVWRFWYRIQRILPLLSTLVKTVAAAQAHSAAAERTGSLFTHDLNSQTDATSVQTAVIRQRAHYATVVDPMQNMPLSDLDILNPQ